MAKEGFRVSFPDTSNPGRSFQLDITPEVGIALAEGRAEFPFSSLPAFPYDLTMSPHAAMLGLLDTQKQIFHHLFYSAYDVTILRDALVDTIYSIVLPMSNSQNRYPQSELNVEMEEALRMSATLLHERPMEPNDLLYGLLQSSHAIRHIVDNAFQPGTADVLSNNLKGIIESSHRTNPTV
jgi:hypothetical protein